MQTTHEIIISFFLAKYNMKLGTWVIIYYEWQVFPNSQLDEGNLVAGSLIFETQGNKQNIAISATPEYNVMPHVITNIKSIPNW